MVLFELGSRITGALAKMSNKTLIDQRAVDELLKEICNALITANVDVKLAFKLRENMSKSLDLEKMAGAVNKRRLIRAAVIEELVKLVDPGTPVWRPRRRHCNVIMFVGLQGSGKTTTVVKLAAYYKRQGWKVGVVCADTFRAGAYDQLRQMAFRAHVHVYGSYSETDPVAVARQGVEQYRADGFEIIIVDTSGRHKQESALFEEMVQVKEAVKPENIIFLMDGSIGQAARGQATAFKDAVPVGSVVITKMDGHAKGGGALAAVAATQSPIIFVGTGEHITDLDPFEPRQFVHKMLNMGNVSELAETLKNAVDTKQQADALGRIAAGEDFTLRMMRDQYKSMMKLGPLTKVLEMMPGMAGLVQQSKASGIAPEDKLKNYMVILAAMTNGELDDPRVLQDKKTKESRIKRIARGSGRAVREVYELIAQYEMFRDVMKKKGFKQLARGGGHMNARQMQQSLGGLLPSGMDPSAMHSIMKQMGM